MNNMSYLWWPQKAIINWGPGINYNCTWTFNDRVPQNTDLIGSMNFEFAGQVKVSGSVRRLMERYRDIDFDKTQYGVSATINRFRKVLFTGSYNGGDEIRFVSTPFLGSNGQFSATVTFFRCRGCSRSLKSRRASSSIRASTLQC